MRHTRARALFVAVAVAAGSTAIAAPAHAIRATSSTVDVTDSGFSVATLRSKLLANITFYFHGGNHNLTIRENNVHSGPMGDGTHWQTTLSVAGLYHVDDAVTGATMMVAVK